MSAAIPEAHDVEFEKISASLAPASNEPLLDVWNVRKYFPIRGGVLSSRIGDVKAVDGVSFSIRRGETVGLVGESGCGKTTVGRVVLRLIEPTSGHAFYRPPPEVSDRLASLYSEIRNLQSANIHAGPDAVLADPRLKPILLQLDTLASKYSIFRLKGQQMKKVRGKMQIVFQDPFSSLSPRMLVRDIVAEPMAIHHVGSRNQRYKRVAELLADVGLNPEHLWRFPHEFSGGQRQRLGIARALALEPEFIVLDEPTSALDVSVQAQILNILLKLQRDHHLAYLFISHHLSVVRAVSHRVVVMYLGKVVETAKTEELFRRPLHPYTQALLSAIPIPDPHLRRQRIILKGDVPSPAAPPKGCRFHTRCPMVMPICSQVEPMLLPIPGRPNHLVACHLYTEGTQGVPIPKVVPGIVSDSESAKTLVPHYPVTEEVAAVQPATELQLEAGGPTSPQESPVKPEFTASSATSPPSSPSPAHAVPLPPTPSGLGSPSPVLPASPQNPPSEGPTAPTPPSLPKSSPLPSSQARPTPSRAPPTTPSPPPPPPVPSFRWRTPPIEERALSADATLSPSLGRPLRDRYKAKP